MKRVILLVLLISMISISCGDRPEYSQSISIEGDWTYDVPLVYSFDIKSPTEVYDLLLRLDYSTDFGYQNIYVKIKTEYPSSDSTDDIVSLNLTDGSGGFLGDCNNSSCEVDILLQEKFRFKETGKHTITISQNGRQENLSGVKSAELSLYKHKR